MRAVWITYYELQNMIKNCTQKQFREKVQSVFYDLSAMNFNTVTVHVRPYGDAFYPSAYFPSSAYCFDCQGADMPYDPLAVLCETAKEMNLKIEAWINPYRVSDGKDIHALCDDNQAKIWYFDDAKKSNVYICEKGIFFNPASADVTDLIADGVREVVENYAVDAVHFDDYFYPSAEEDIDEKEFHAYQKNGGNLALPAWRRENINQMLKTVYQSVKKANPEVRFGISPAANIREDYENLYADVNLWMQEDGYADYLCPQVYFGFKNVFQPFMLTVKKWANGCRKDLYIGLPLYKAGKPDRYAGSDQQMAINEFVENENILSRQITYLSKLPQVKGFYIFSYSCLYDETCRKEAENMIKTMQDICR